MTICQIDMYLNLRIDVCQKVTNKTKITPAAGGRRELGLGRTRTVGTGEQGEACPAISAPRGGPQLDLGRLRPKTWYEPDFSIAGTTWRKITLHVFTRGASPRRANARLGSTHARNTEDV